MTVNIDGTPVNGVTIDGEEVQQVTVDGNIVFEASFTEDFNTFDTNTWTLFGDATYDSANNRVQLNSGSGGTGGTVQYDDGVTNSFDIDLTFTNGADGADEVTVIFKYDKLQSDGANNIWRPQNGYTVDFDHYNDQIELLEYTNGSSTSLASTAQTIGSGTFTGRVEYNNGSVTVDFEGSQVLTHTISSPNSFEALGYSGRDGGVTGTHYLESTTISGGGNGTTDGGIGTLLQDDFNDGNYNGWTVHSGTWAVENGELHQNSANNGSEISHPVSIGPNKSVEWQFDIMQEEEFFGKNVYLYHSNSSPGGSPTDQARVFHANGNSSPQYYISLGVNGTEIARTNAGSQNTFRNVRVTHDGSGNWELYVDGSFIGSGSETISTNSQLFYLRYDQQGRFDNLTID